MTLSKLSPMTIVLSLVALLSLMASLSPPVLSLDTGYDYRTNENPSEVQLYRDLKCTYLIAGMTQMRLVKLMLENEKLLNKNVIGLVKSYRIRAIICALYDVTHVKIGSLWLLLLFVITMESYYKQYVLKSEIEAFNGTPILRPEEVAGKVAFIYDYVTRRVQAELTAARCRPDNRFDTYNDWYRQKVANSPSGKVSCDDIRAKGFNNCENLRILLDGNNAKDTYAWRFNTLKSRQLFVRYLGTNTDMMSKLMNGYDVQISWHGTAKMLKDDLNYAQKMLSPTILLYPLFSIKKYYQGVYCLFKSIMYKLTWKFLLYVDNYSDDTRNNFLKTWHSFLIEFQNLLCLQDDEETGSLVKAIIFLGRNELVVKDIIKQLKLKLHEFNVCLLCDATEEMTLQSGQEAIKSDSLTNARAFIVDLNSAVRDVDFNVIQSIMLYIEQETKCCMR